MATPPLTQLISRVPTARHLSPFQSSTLPVAGSKAASAKRDTFVPLTGLWCCPMHLKWPPTMMNELSGALSTLQRVSVQVPVIQAGVAFAEMLLMLNRLTASHIPTFEAPVA